MLKFVFCIEASSWGDNGELYICYDYLNSVQVLAQVDPHNGTLIRAFNLYLRPTIMDSDPNTFTFDYSSLSLTYNNVTRSFALTTALDRYDLATQAVHIYLTVSKHKSHHR